ncbi:phage tail protein [Pseudoalteromonas sp. R86517]|uniref:phage tail-collar fiber domain-containing protein n=1 Tax=Pseudoalteromonas sp. R86517 TaxID=3093857 RepID=UPI0036726D28
MSQVVTNAGEALFAQKAQANEQLDIDTFIFAYVPGQDSQAPVDRSEGLPPTAQQVHTQPVQQVGRINNNTVVYSTVLNSLTGPFEFNWVGLYSSVNNTLVAISHVKSVNKTITELGNAGNTLNRNFAIEYSGISDITGITVAPETWQLDFSARLAGMDALTQNLAMDMNGRDWFIGDGFKVEPTANDDEFRVIAGVGYVHGMRLELEQDYVFSVQSYPQNVYVDALFEGDVSSQWKPQYKFTLSNAQQEDYMNENGVNHYVFKISVLSGADAVEDLRNNNGLAAKLEDYILKNRSEVDNTESLKELFGLVAGMKVSTKGYYEPLDGGNTTYEISTNSDIDGYSSFEIIGGLYAHPYRKQNGLTSTQFGVMPDGVTNWEADQGLRMKALYAALNKGVEVKFVRVGEKYLYNTGMNIYNNYAQKWTMSFDEGVEFGNIFHIISSGSAIFDRRVSIPINSPDQTLTFPEPHGMITPRMCTFVDTGTILDKGSYLVTPTDSRHATVDAPGLLGNNINTGRISDTPIKNVILKGTYTTYDRFGCINVDGLTYDRVHCKSDPTKHATGGYGGGVHIFTMCKNFNGRDTIIDDTQSQAQSANQHAAFACDGIGLENNKFGRVWVKDSRCNGAIIQGEGCSVDTLIVDAYGRGVMSSVIPFVGQSDLQGGSSANIAHGVWLSRSCGKIGYIRVNQKYGFDGRGYAHKDVVFDRDFLRWDSPNQSSFLDEELAMSVGHIECLNPQYVAVDLGTYKGWCSPSIGKISLGIIPDENEIILSDASRLDKGLINIGYTRAKIGKVKCKNAKQSSVILHNPLYTPANTPAMLKEPSLTLGSFECGDHSASPISIHCKHDIGNVVFDKVTIKGSYYLEPSVLIGTRAICSDFGPIHAKSEVAVNKKLLEYGAQHSMVGPIDSHNITANKSTNDATIHIKNSKYSKLRVAKVNADSLSANGGGIKYTGTYNFTTENLLVDKMAQGVIDGGGNGRMIAIGCVSLGNSTASDLPKSVLVGDVGNYQWSV